MKAKERKNMMSSKPITVGVLGLGRSGWNIHVEALKGRSDFAVTAVADPDPERCDQAEKELECRSFGSRDELLREGDCEVIVVATPNTLHEVDSIAVAESGRHCVLEKPIAGNWAGASQVVKAFQKNGRHVFPHHQQLFSSEHLFLCDLVDSGKLGEIFEIRYHWVNYARRNDWQTLRKNGGGLYTNHGAHALSTMLDLLGAPISALQGVTRHIKDAGDADDHVAFVLEAANGRRGVLMLSSCCVAPMPRFVVLGSAGSAWREADSEQVKVKFYDASKVAPLEVREGAAAGRSYGTGETLPWQEEVLELSAYPKARFYDNVAAVLRGDAEPVVTGESAIQVARVLEWGGTGRDPAAGAGVG